MGRLVAILIILGITGFGSYWAYDQYTSQEARVKMKAALADARRSFASLARSAVIEKEDDAYRRRIQSALQSYEDELGKRVYAERPEWRDTDGYKDQVEARFTDGQLPEARRKSMLEGYSIVKEAYETLKKGQWKSILTQIGAGDTRLDVYEMRRVRDSDGNPLLEGRFFFWGIEDTTRVNWGQLSLRYWYTVKKPKKRGRRRAIEEIEEVLGRAEGDATPRIIIQRPQEYIEEFPSYVSVGYIWLPVMPREATNFDMTMTYVARKGGGSHDAELKWKKLPIPARWQLQAGESWDADVVEATEEEIAGKDDEEEEAPKDGAKSEGQ